MPRSEAKSQREYETVSKPERGPIRRVSGILDALRTIPWGSNSVFPAIPMYPVTGRIALARPMSHFLLITALVVLLVGGHVGSVRAQIPEDSVRARAERDFHGPDRTGKDGPLRAASLDLLMLYHRYRGMEHERAAVPSPSLCVEKGHVAVDAIAAGPAEPLRSDLERLGMTETAVAGRVVSGQLPIEQIPEAARLSTLRGLLPSSARTRAPSPPPTPSDPSRLPDSGASEETPPDSSRLSEDRRAVRVSP